MTTSKTIYQNQLLNRLTAGDRELLEPHLVEFNLVLLHVLEEPGQRIKHVYFIDAGIASVVAHSAEDRQIEIGLIGREGVTGTAVILGNSQSPLQTYVQVAGSAVRISTPKLRAAMMASTTLAGLLLKYVQAAMVQTAHTAYANALGHVDVRLARWLLMADDRCGDTIPLSHKFLSIMLGVRRTGVTESLGELQRRGTIAIGRGRIEVLNRAALATKAGPYYGAPEAEYRRLIG
jgi:CRP-like cAMP-binding protein